jgi:hypothetical protein
MKKLLSIVIAVSMIGIVTWSYAGKTKQKPLSKSGPHVGLHWGEHVGEVKQLEVDVAFSGQYGQTVTDENGIFYHFWGYVFHEDKVYPPEYWGVFPLYFFDTEVGATVTVKNNGPRKRAKLRIRTEVYCLRADGSNGAELTSPQEVDIDLGPGETATINASFIAGYAEGAESGLDRMIIKVLHPNTGGGPGNSDPALIMMKEAIFCPPEYMGEALDALSTVLP